METKSKDHTTVLMHLGKYLHCISNPTMDLTVAENTIFQVDDIIIMNGKWHIITKINGSIIAVIRQRWYSRIVLLIKSFLRFKIS